ncbi:MAG: ROK family transcriptional regulator [Actinomycetota bacterium]|nr:ROK family transcriptional regulator [Actinomycetota bacterium]
MARTTRGAEARWRTSKEVLRHIRRRPGITRAELGRELGLSSGSTTETVTRLRGARLLAEVPASPTGRGRPSAVLVPHPSGPVVLALELRHEDWRCAVAGVDGALGPVRARRHASRERRQVLDQLAQAVREMRRCYGRRLRAVSVAAAGAVHDGTVVHASTLQWGPLDMAGLVDDTGLPLLVGNDAACAGVAEARAGAAASARTCLHLLVDVGIGGSLIVDGQPLRGARGASGEFGHLALGERHLRCPCGATGCWDLEVDGRALARHLGVAPPEDPHTFARMLLARAPRRSAAAAFTAVSSALGSGIAGLVNALDPEVVSLGGLAPQLRDAARNAFDSAYLDGLMGFRRADPPPVVRAAFADDGALRGAAELGLDLATSESGIMEWMDEGAEYAGTSG